MKFIFAILISYIVLSQCHCNCNDFLPTESGDGYFISYKKNGERNDDVKVSDVTTEFLLRKKNLK
jgi:hypothetical protein